MPDSGQRPAYISGGWKIDLARRELRLRGALVPLGGRAFDVVEVLVRSAGELVTKDDLMAQVWEGTIVEENTLQYHISTIRRALAPDRAMLQTVSGRGYRLLGDWTIAPEGASETPTEVQLEPAFSRSSKGNLPLAVAELIGRSDATQHLRQILSSYRAVTLTGPGGIGKSKLALDVARSLLASFEGDVWLVELVSLLDPDLVPSSVISALGLKVGGGEMSTKAIARAVAGRKLLIVLDNCEHVIDTVALLTETLLRECPYTSVLATSRETLRIDGEYIYRVPSLDVPSRQVKSQEDLLRSSAVQLFMARVNASGQELEINERTLATIVAICRRLDGIPLAIEFAAARASTLGLPIVLSRLDDRFRLLTQGHRAAPPRHQTLHAVLDWSYQLLSETEKALLSRLAIFAFGFTLEAAGSVIADDVVPLWGVEDGIAGLVAKSLIAVDLTAVSARYWLLETTRSYAREKLSESGELEQIARRHAEYYRDLFERAERGLETQISDEWLSTSGLVDEVRGALDWAFSPGGDPSLGVAVTTASVPLWFHLTLLAEFRRHLERALRSSNPEAGPTPHQEMQLLAALSITLLITTAYVSDMRASWSRVREIAERLGDTRYKLRALGGLWEIALNSGAFRETLTLAQEAYEMAGREVNTANLPASSRMMGASLHYLGDQAGARQYLEQILDHKGVAHRRSRAWNTLIDPQVSGRSALARVYWIQGFPDQAVRMANSATVEGRSSNSPFMFCFALTWAAYPVAMLNGDLAAAEAAVALLLDTSAEHRASIYEMWGRRCQATLLAKKGDAENSVLVLRDTLNTFRERGLTLAYTSTMCDCAEALGLAGRLAEGLAAIDDALTRCERVEERWCIAELLRVKGALLLSMGGPDAMDAAEDLFMQGLDWARGQGALSWELRCATSLAQLLRFRPRANEPHDRLAQVYNRFTEGFTTADLRTAKALLDEAF
jgi:predicted ATPase/DNA-binding winged helix-turn-helix (wHTH) protein